jgi:hypothetical protein
MYKQTDISGSEYVRCPQIVIENPLAGQALIQFREERVAVLPDRNIITPEGLIVVPFDPGATIALRNPMTDELTGATITHGEIYAILYSAYLQTALARDGAQHEIPPDEEDGDGS